MGYAHYILPDGREAGYSVEATCDKDGCEAQIDRGLAYLCGDYPGPNPEVGCGDYFCGEHEYNHDCPNAECGLFSADGNLCCSLPDRHDGAHEDEQGDSFIKTEHDAA